MITSDTVTRRRVHRSHDGQRREVCIRPVGPERSPCGASVVIVAGQGDARADVWQAHDAAAHDRTEARP